MPLTIQKCSSVHELAVGVDSIIGTPNMLQCCWQQLQQCILACATGCIRIGKAARRAWCGRFTFCSLQLDRLNHSSDPHQPGHSYMCMSDNARLKLIARRSWRVGSRWS